MTRYILGFVTALALPMLTPAPALSATASAPRITVMQVMAMLERAPGDPVAAQVLTAYLAGLGETAGAMIESGGVSCRAPLTLDGETARRALAAATGASAAAEPATPLILGDMLDRAGCRR